MDRTERLHFHFSLSCIGEGNGNPLQCSCLENPRDGRAWWAAVYGVSQSQTRLKRLSSSRSRRLLSRLNEITLVLSTLPGPWRGFQKASYCCCYCSYHSPHVTTGKLRHREVKSLTKIPTGLGLKPRSSDSLSCILLYALLRIFLGDGERQATSAYFSRWEHKWLRGDLLGNHRTNGSAAWGAGGARGGGEDAGTEIRGCPSTPPVDFHQAASPPPCSVPAPSLGIDKATTGHLQPGGPGSLHTAGGSVPVDSAPALCRAAHPRWAPAPETLNQFRTPPPRTLPPPHTPSPECSPRSLEERWGRPGNPLPRPGCCVHYAHPEPGGPGDSRSGDDGLRFFLWSILQSGK